MAAPGGRWTVEVANGKALARIVDFQPSLPRPLYAITHLQVHLLFTRLFLLRLRGQKPAPGLRASPRDRVRAAAVDVALCLTINRVLSRRMRPATAVALLAAYHVGFWTLSGRTLGGLMMGQRVVAADGRPLTPAQSLLRLACAPLSWIMKRPVHDEIAGTDVIVEQKEGAARAAPLSESI
jgi:hypothetical protein